MEENLEKIDISIVIPAYNEGGSLSLLASRLISTLDDTGENYEIIFVNDGSTDDSEKIINELCARYSFIKAIHFRTNFGKSKALATGFAHAGGELIVMIDADLQDQPEEIPSLIRYLRENKLDVVTGWKKDRKDPISKTLPSKIFNGVVQFLSGLRVHDFNCGLKVMRHECCQKLKLYGQLHRFILVLLSNKGYKIGEVPVQHAQREFGVSKFGSKRIYHGMMDFLTVFFITRYFQSPLYFFGFYGFICFIVSIGWGGFFIGTHYISYFMNQPKGMLSEHPLWLLSPFLFIIGFIFIAFGLLGELILNVSFSGEGTQHIKSAINIKIPNIADKIQ